MASKHFIITAALLLMPWVGMSAQRRQVSVSSVGAATTLKENVDFIITSPTPFTSSGYVDIINDDAVVILPSLRPSQVYTSWLSHIKVKGAAATRSSVWVAIYDNGAIVFPHPKEDYTPLTVYTDVNFSGDSRNDFRPFDFYNNTLQLGSWENNICSFRLKRGYMVTFACNYDGTGYSRVFIAQDTDIEVAELQRELKGRIGFIRVFPWNRVSKKGCGAFDWNPGNVLNVSWGYDWGAGGSPFADDVDYVGMHHHEDWPDYNEIATSRGFNTVLGNNEPDNLNDLSQNPIPAGQMEAVLFGENGLTGSWRNIYRGGYRIGSPAMAGDYDFLRAFMDLCHKYNYRIDFIATHRYLMGTGWDYDWFVNWIYDQYHLPVWITEWNYGAEWNGFLDGPGQGPDFFRNQIAGITPILEANQHLERQAFFNVLGDANRMMTNRHEGMRLMPAGEWYRDYKSVTSYTGGEEYVMVWNYWAPKDLTISFNDREKVAILTWLNLNGKQTDSTLVERRLPDEKEWTVINRRYMQSAPQQIFRADTLKGVSGIVTYRVRNFDSDGRIRTTDEVVQSVGGADGNDILQFGNISLTDATSSVKVDFTNTFDRVPAVFVGPLSDKTTNVNISPVFTSGSIGTTSFNFTPIQWKAQPNAGTDFTQVESVPFISIMSGHYDWGSVVAEVGTITLRDTVNVEFTQPFAEGTTPVVIVTPNRTTQRDIPLLCKVWNVTNSGFRCVVSYEQGLNRAVALNQQLSYLAVSQGKACIDPQRGICIAAGLSDRKIYTLSREVTFTIPSTDGTDKLDTLMVEKPVILAALQTDGTAVPTALRLTSPVERYIPTIDGQKIMTIGGRFRRAVDLSNGQRSLDVDNSRTADLMGWVTIYHETDYTTTAIQKLYLQDNPQTNSAYTTRLTTSVIDRRIYVSGHEQFMLYNSAGMKFNPESTLRPGIYIVKVGNSTAKVVVK